MTKKNVLITSAISGLPMALNTDLVVRVEAQAGGSKGCNIVMLGGEKLPLPNRSVEEVVAMLWPSHSVVKDLSN